MSHHVVGEASPFRKRVLLPLWVIRIAAMIFYAVIYVLTIVVIATDDTFATPEDVPTSWINTGPAIAILAVVLVLILACLTLEVVCIIKLARRTLGPRFFLAVNVVQVVFWTVHFVLIMIGAHANGLAVTISVIVYLCYLVLLAYAVVIFHKSRRGTLFDAKRITSAFGSEPNPSHSKQNQL